MIWLPIIYFAGVLATLAQIIACLAWPRFWCATQASADRMIEARARWQRETGFWSTVLICGFSLFMCSLGWPIILAIGFRNGFCNRKAAK